jgi:hypothetical protein
MLYPGQVAKCRCSGVLIIIFLLRIRMVLGRSLSVENRKYWLCDFHSTGSGDHPASYPMAAGSPFPGGKAAGA